MRRSLVPIIVLIVVVPMLIIASMVILLVFGGSSLNLPRLGNKVALVRIEGVIVSGKAGSGIFGGGYAGSERVIKALEQVRRDPFIKAVVVRINSPGGSAAASQEIYQEVLRVRKSGRKVVASMGDVAASGGYYVASAADEIYADPASLTGSIGVLIETTDLHVLLDRLGVRFDTVKSGEHKDMGTFSRPLTEKERQILQRLINDVYDQFLADVQRGRKLPREYVRGLADGRVFTGRQAKAYKLVDELGGLEDALKAAARDAGIKGDFEVVEYEPRGLWGRLLGGTEALSQDYQASRAVLDLARGLLLHEVSDVR